MRDFVGTWHAEGQLGDGTPAASDDSFELMPGDFFLVRRGVLRPRNGRPLESLLILGFDEGTGRYRLHLFDNGGYARLYEGVYDGGAWHLAGPHERVRIELERDGDVMHVAWEQSDDSRTWRPLCTLRAVRLTRENRDEPTPARMEGASARASHPAG